MKSLLLSIFLLFFATSSFAQQQKEEDKETLAHAIEYFNAQKYHEAGLLLRKLSETYSLNSRYKAYLALCEYYNWNYEEATEIFDVIMPDLEPYAPAERSVYFFAAAESHFALGNYTKAAEYFEQKLTVCNEKEKAETFYRLGFCHLFLDDKAAAKSLFQQSLEFYERYGEGKNAKARKAQLKRMIKGL